MPKVQRKRKWLSNEQAANASLLNSKKQLTISSDTLKSFLPNPASLKDKTNSVATQEASAVAEPDQKNRNVVSTNGTSDDSTKRKVILEVSNNSTMIN